MARLNIDFEPVPQVAPTAGSSAGGFRIQANPAAFGAPEAQGLEKLGQGVEHAAESGIDAAVQQQQMQDKTHAAELHSWASNQWSENSGNFLSLEGRAAVDGVAAYKQKNEQIFQGALSQAADPYTRLLVQTESRRAMDSHNEMAERHAAAQGKTWQHNVATLNEASNGNQAVLFATNGDIPSAQRFLGNATNEARNQAELQGFSGDTLEQVARQKRGGYVMQIVEGIARKEGTGYGPKAAEEFYKSERDKIDAGSATRIEGFLRNDLTKIDAQQRAQDIWKNVGNGLSNRAASVETDTKAKLQEQGIPLRVTSEFRSPEHNAAVGGARGSQHLHGNAFDASLNGLSPEQQQIVINQVLSDPRVGGFGYYPRSNSIHVDVRQGGRAAWGTDYHGTSVGEGWPGWLTTTVRQWQAGATGATPAPAEGGAPQVNAPPLQPASYEGPEITPAVAAASHLPAAIAPTWQEKKAVATAQVLSDPYYHERPELQSAMLGQINRMADMEHAAAIDTTAAEKAQEKAVKQASDSAEIEVMQDAYSRTPKIGAGQMLARTDLTREAKERLLKFYPVNEDRESDLKHYGFGFFDAYKAIHAPVGDPSRITNPDKLYDMTGPNGSLTVAGVDKLLQEMYKPKTPETAAENEMKKTFLDSAKRQVSGEGLIPGMKDPKGEQIFLGYLGYFFPAYEKGRAVGKSPAELLDPNSKDYLGKSLDTMKRPMSEWYSDALKDNPSVATGAKPEVPAFNPTSVKSMDELKAALAGGKLDRAQAIQIGLQHGWIRENPVKPPPPPAATAPQLPISR